MIRRRCSFKKYAWKVVSGKSPLIINNSERDRFRSFSVIGKSEQVTTTGAQLFDASKFDGMTQNGVSISVKDGVITATGMATKDERIQAYISVEEYKKIFKPGEKIFIKSYKTTDCNYDFGLYGAHGSPILGTVTEGNSQPNGTLLPTIYPARDTDFYFFVSVKQGVTLQGSLQPMVYQMGNGTYEPYTGCKPSPSPEYPQEIKSVGKWNPETQKYEVDVRVIGKNLFDIEKAKSESNWLKVEGDGYVHFPIRVKNGSKVTFSYDEKLTTGKKFYLGVSIGKTGNVTNWLYHGATASLINNKATIVSSDGYVNLLCNKGAVQDFIDNIKTLQIEISDKKTEYQPYKEQTVTLTSDRPITKWDKLVEQDGQIGWLYGSKIYVVTGNEVFESRNGYNIESYTNRFFVLNDLLMDNDVPKPLAYVKCLRRKQYVYAPNIFEEGFETNKNQFHIKFLNERVGISTSDDHAVRTLKYSEYIKNIYKSGEPIEILYATKNKEFVPLPQSEQDSIRSFISYSPTTIITVDGGEVDPIVEVLYAIKEMM